jgi:hypothetical protein
VIAEGLILDIISRNKPVPGMSCCHIAKAARESTPNSIMNVVDSSFAFGNAYSLRQVDVADVVDKHEVLGVLVFSKRSSFVFTNFPSLIFQ